MNIKNIINYLKAVKLSITLKQIATKYNEIYNKKISLKAVSRILKKHLNIRHLTTSVKNPKLDNNNYIIMTLF